MSKSGWTVAEVAKCYLENGIIVHDERMHILAIAFSHAINAGKVAENPVYPFCSMYLSGKTYNLEAAAKTVLEQEA